MNSNSGSTIEGTYGGCTGDWRKTVLLAAGDIRSLFSMKECIEAVEGAFRLYGEGKALRPEMMHVDTTNGQFHIKAGGLELDPSRFSVKINGDFPLNVDRFGMPSLLGLIALCSGETGYPLAIMDSREITLLRTGAATAVAAKYLANPNSETVTICGCGAQGRIQLKALAQILPIKKAFAFSRDQQKAQSYAAEMSEELGIEVAVVDNLESALERTDVCVTCTRSTQSFIPKEYICPGTFVAAVGADSPGKQELDPILLVSNKVVVDLLGQCARVGELHYALDCGLSQEDVYAELGDIVSEKKPGRCSTSEIIIFDSTGTALQDVAAAAAIYRKAVLTESGADFDFFQ